MVEGGPNSSIFQEYCQHNTPNHGNNTCGQEVWREMLCMVTNLEEDELATCLNETDKKGFKGYQPGVENSEKPGNTHTNDLDNNDIIIVVSSILFIFIVTILISVLYYRHKQHIWEDGEEFLLTDTGFQTQEHFNAKC